MDDHRLQQVDRSRSRSPYRDAYRSEKRRRRSPSPRQEVEISPRSHHRRGHGTHLQTTPLKSLPFDALQLSRSDLLEYRPIFALYLDIQKGRLIEELPEDEVKGRWKSFLGKWNRGELAEGWYDPQILTKAQKQSTFAPEPDRLGSKHEGTSIEDNDSDDEDQYGPTLPTRVQSSSTVATENDPSNHKQHHGPTIPSLPDLNLRDKDNASSEATAQHASHSLLKSNRKAERHNRAANLDELTSRSAPGTKDRALEKRREARYVNTTFADAAHDSGVAELGDAEMFSGGGDEDLKRMKERVERKKSERELRREEILRARRAEREERLGAMREREERVMGMLRGLARERFGGGGAEG